MESSLAIETNTFRNLPEEKRQRILEEAVKEFAANGYQKASLNTIVKRLGIAKGSLYQYFNNKQALFLFIFDRLTHLVKDTVKRSVSEGEEADFFEQVRRIIVSGINFIDSFPAYYQIYLKVLFEPDVPQREELIAKVRLFSMEFFAPLCNAAQGKGQIRHDIPTSLVVFILDAVVDRFLQGYAKPYLDGGLNLSAKSPQGLEEDVNMIITILQDGLCLQKGE